MKGVGVSLCVSVCPSVSVPLSPFVSVSVSLCLCLSVSVSLSLSVCLSFSLSLCLSLSLPLSLSSNLLCLRFSRCKYNASAVNYCLLSSPPPPPHTPKQNLDLKTCTHCRTKRIQCGVARISDGGTPTSVKPSDTEFAMNVFVVESNPDCMGLLLCS